MALAITHEGVSLLPYRLQTFHRVDDYQAAALPFLRQRAADLNQMLYAAESLRDDDVTRLHTWFACLYQGTAVVAIAACTSPPPVRELSLSGWPTAGIGLLAHALDGYPLTSLLGPAPAVEACALALGLPRLRAHYVNYVLQRAPTAPPAPGTMVPASMDHVLQLVDWSTAFSREVGMPERSPDHLTTRLRHMLTADSVRQLTLWSVDDVPVAMGILMVSATTARISEVYTLPGHRGHGYAGALVAALARDAFARGAAHVCLFADAANPTSNGLYQRIGFAECGRFTHHDRGVVTTLFPVPA